MFLKRNIYAFQGDIKTFPSLSFTFHIPERGRSGSALFPERSESFISLIIYQINKIYAASYTTLVTPAGNLYMRSILYNCFS